MFRFQKLLVHTFLVILLVGLTSPQSTKEGEPFTHVPPDTSTGGNGQEGNAETTEPAAESRVAPLSLAELLQQDSLSPKDKVFAVPVSSNKILVEWEMVPSSFLNNVQSYRLFYTRQGGANRNARERETEGTSVTLTGLKPYSFYDIGVIAQSSEGTFAYQTVSARTFQDAPSGAPRDIQLNPVSASTIELSWSPPPSQKQNGIIVEYRIRFRRVGDSAPQVLIVDGEENSYILTGLLRDTAYEVRLAAATVNGTGPFSSWRGTRTLDEEPEPPIPPPVSSVSVEPSVFTAEVTWTLPLDGASIVEGFIVGYGATLGDEVFTAVQPTRTSYNITDLDPDTSYVVSVRTFNQVGDSSILYEDFVTLPESLEPPIPPPVSSVSVEPSVFTAEVTWTLPLDGAGIVEGFIVGYGTTLGDEIFTAVQPTRTSFTITDLDPDTSYVVSISTFNQVGDSSALYEDFVTLPESLELEVPSPPGSLTVEPSTTWITVRWIAPQDDTTVVKGYILGYGTTVPDESIVYIQPVDTLYNLTGLVPGFKYILSLRAYNDVGESIALYRTADTLPVTLESPFPQSPTGLVLNPSTTSVLVSWDAPPSDTLNLEGYKLNYRSGTEGGTTITLDPSHTSCNVTTLVPDTFYTFELVAYNSQGESASVRASISTLPQETKTTVPQTTASVSMKILTTLHKETSTVSQTTPSEQPTTTHSQSTSSSTLKPISTQERAVQSTERQSTIHQSTEHPSTAHQSTEHPSTAHQSTESQSTESQSTKLESTTLQSTTTYALMPPPEPASSLSVEPSRSSVMVSWTPPLEDTSPVTGYTLRYRNEDSDNILVSLPSDQFSHEVAGLPANTEVVFELRTFNSGGESRPVVETVATLQSTIDPTDYCQSDNGGCSHDCVNLGKGKIECQCPEGYQLDPTEKLCTDIDECQTDPELCSSPSVKCINYPGTFACECSEGYEEYNAITKFCEDIDECEEDPFLCGNTATCVNTFGGYECPCKTGFVYPDNEAGTSGNCVDVDECEFEELVPLFCGPHASCKNTQGGYECECLPGFDMDEGFCFDVNECEVGNPCGLNGVCQNLEGSFFCSCGEGYIEEDGRCIDIDECALTGDLKACPETMACVNYEGSFHCFCPPGFIGNGSYCEDIDECASSDNPCSEYAFCGNLVGSFYCQCTHGYAGNGRDCFDVNECEMSNGGCPQQCTNTRGSFYCSCGEGFKISELDSSVCEDIDECTLHAPCEQHCNNTVGSYICWCDPGFSLHPDGHLCVDTDECMLENDCEEICVNTPGSYECECGDMRVLIRDNTTHCKDITNCREKNGGCEQNCRKDQRGILCSCGDGFIISPDGRTCVDVNECLDVNGGCEQLCENTPGSYICRCRTGYRPRDDSRYQCVSECDPPCMNYGVCTGPNICVCPAGYGGPTCEPTCNPPCAHGGTCRRYNMCQCRTGYTGPACQRATCSLPCMNGGYCVGPNICQCPARYTGDRCQTPKCVPGCQNGGSCYTVNTCICPEGFFGPRCQHERKMCTYGFCKNGGVCSGVNKCRCPSGFSGTRCAKRLPRNCVPPCLQGGTCLANNRCACPRGVTGVRCQTRTCAVESYQITHVEFKTRYFNELHAGMCGPFGFRICNQYRLVTRRVTEIVYRAAYRSTC